MISESRACPGCGEPVLGGRLTCSSCGELLAVVEGAAPRPSVAPAAGEVALAETERPSPPEVPVAPPAVPAAASADEGLTGIGAAAAVGLPPEHEQRPASSGSEPEPGKGREAELAGGPAPDLVPAEAAEAPEPGAYLPPPAHYPSPVVAGAAEALPPDAAVGSEPGQAGPGQAAAVASAGARSLADAGGSQPSRDAVPIAPSEPTRGAADARSPARPAFVVPADIAGRVVAIAAPIAALSFLLPFAAPGSIVLGGAEGGDYFSDWGLAAPANLVPFGLAILLFILAVVPSGLADWFRFGVLPLVLGGGLAAIGWLAVTWPGGYGVGVVVLLGAAVALLGAGVLAVRNAAAGRHVT